MNITGLTDDEMRVRIAIATGCKCYRRPFDGKVFLCKEAPSGDWSTTDRYPHQLNSDIPDYLNDLNAMHAAEKSIKCRHTLALYDEYLRREANPNTDRLAKDWTWEELGRAARADARQRALAFLAMLPEPEAGR